MVFDKGVPVEDIFLDQSDGIGDRHRIVGQAQEQVIVGRPLPSEIDVRQKAWHDPRGQRHRGVVDADGLLLVIPQIEIQDAARKVVGGEVEFDGHPKPIGCVVGEGLQVVAFPKHIAILLLDGEHELAIDQGVGETVVGLESQVQVAASEAVGKRIAEPQAVFVVGEAGAAMVHHRVEGQGVRAGVLRQDCVGNETDVGPRRIPSVAVLEVVAERLPLDGQGHQEQHRQQACFASVDSHAVCCLLVSQRYGFCENKKAVDYSLCSFHRRPL